MSIANLGSNRLMVPKPMDGAATLFNHARGAPASSSAAEKRATAAGRYRSCWVSSSRVQTSLTGAPLLRRAIATACSTMSVSRRRPKPPPRYGKCSVTASIAMSATCAAFQRASEGTWVEHQTLSLPSLNWAVQLTGSSAAWARNGTSYSASILRAAPASAAAASPWLRKPEPLDSSSARRNWALMAAESSAALAPSSQSIWTPSSAVLARQKLSATATTAVLPRPKTSLTPRADLAAPALKPRSVPPNTGHWRIAA